MLACTALAVFALTQPLPGLDGEVGLPVHEARLTAVVPEPESDFGAVLALEADTLAVAAPLAGIAPDRGLVHLFERADSIWTLVAELGPCQPGWGEPWGCGLSVSGPRLALGAPTAGAQRQGQVHLYVRDAPGSWSLEHVVDPGPVTDIRFGGAVEVQGSRMAVGAPFWPIIYSEYGAGYVYEWNGTDWELLQEFMPAILDLYARVGQTVALDGDRVLFGAPGARLVPSQINGIVYVYDRQPGGQWELDAELGSLNSRYGDEFASSLDYAEGLVVAGAPCDDSPLMDAGSVYVFREGPTSWSLEQHLKAPQPQVDDQFGSAVATDGERIYVGARGDQHDGTRRGVVHVFEWDGATWVHGAELVSPTPAVDGRFGDALAIDKNHQLAVGATWEEAGGVDRSGAVHVYRLPVEFDEFCFGEGSGTACPCGNTGDPGHGCGSGTNPSGGRLVGEGVPRLSSDTAVLAVSDLPVGVPCLFFQGDLQLNGGLGIPFEGGLRCVQSNLVRLGVKSATGGNACFPEAGDPPLSVAGQVPAAGASRYYQVWYRDPASPCGSSVSSNLSSAVAIDWAP